MTVRAAARPPRPPHPVVGAPAVDLDGADRARPLLDRADHGGRARRDRRRRRGLTAGRRRPSSDVALGVVGDRRRPEPDGREVALVAQREVAEQAGGPADAEDEHAGGHRVERAGMADLAGARASGGPARRRRATSCPAGLSTTSRPRDRRSAAWRRLVVGLLVRVPVRVGLAGVRGLRRLLVHGRVGLGRGLAAAPRGARRSPGWRRGRTPASG